MSAIADVQKEERLRRASITVPVKPISPPNDATMGELKTYITRLEDHLEKMRDFIGKEIIVRIKPRRYREMAATMLDLLDASMPLDVQEAMWKCIRYAKEQELTMVPIIEDRPEA